MRYVDAVPLCSIRGQAQAANAADLPRIVEFRGKFRQFAQVPQKCRYEMLSLVPFSRAHFPLLVDWFPSHADLVQWGGPFLDFPLSDAQLERMLAEGEIEPPSRLTSS